DEHGELLDDRGAQPALLGDAVPLRPRQHGSVIAVVAALRGRSDRQRHAAAGGPAGIRAAARFAQPLGATTKRSRARTSRRARPAVMVAMPVRRAATCRMLQGDRHRTRGMRKQYYFRNSPRGRLAWDVDRLVELSRTLPVRSVPLSEIRELDEALDHDGQPITWRG